jgi:sulfonate transport system substrate-binding protein
MKKILAVLAAAVAALFAPASRANPPHLDIPYQAITIGQLPLWMALDGGLFQRYGIDASGEFAGQSPALVASILAGETPFANLGQQAVVSADLNGGDIAILVSGPEKLFFGVYGQPGLHTVADLKGKKIGISRFGTTTDFIARHVLQKGGLDPRQDATILPVGSQVDLFAALQSKVIDAAVLGPPIMIKAGRVGFPILANLLDDQLIFYTDALVAKRSWVAAHRAETLDVVRGFVAGIVAVRTQKQRAIATLAKYTKSTDAESLEGAYELLVKALPKVPVPKLAAIQTSLDAGKVPAGKSAALAAAIDPSFVEELDKDGFIARLYKSQE